LSDVFSGSNGVTHRSSSPYAVNFGSDTLQETKQSQRAHLYTTTRGGLRILECMGQVEKHDFKWEHTRGTLIFTVDSDIGLTSD